MQDKGYEYIELVKISEVLFDLRVGKKLFPFLDNGRQGLRLF